MPKDFETPDAVRCVARTLCRSGKFETGEGTCSLLCMDQMGDARNKPCSHIIEVHGELAGKILSQLKIEVIEK